jgi:hypothetical protein
MVFKNREDLESYIASEAHTRFAETIGYSLIKDFIVVDYEIPESKL